MKMALMSKELHPWVLHTLGGHKMVTLFQAPEDLHFDQNI